MMEILKVLVVLFLAIVLSSNALEWVINGERYPSLGPDSPIRWGGKALLTVKQIFVKYIKCIRFVMNGIRS